MMTTNQFVSKVELGKTSVYFKYAKKWFSICSLLVVFKPNSRDQYEIKIIAVLMQNFWDHHPVSQRAESPDMIQMCLLVSF